MKRHGLWLKLAMLACVAIAIVSAPPSSIAYMAANSNTLRNSFRVVYAPAQEIQVPVQIHKTMVSLSPGETAPGGFDFCLIDVDTGEVRVASTTEDGWATILLPFADEDVGKTHRYRLNELNTGRKNVIYDDAVYEIAITLTWNENREISAAFAVDGEHVGQIVAEFENKYYVPVPIPDTGDSSRPVLWLAMLALSAAGLIVLRKRAKNAGGIRG